MKPELKLAQVMSSDEDEQKLASMSINELMTFLKNRKKQPEAAPAPASEPEKKASAPELSAEEKLKQAEAWGRGLAQKEKQAEEIDEEAVRAAHLNLMRQSSLGRAMTHPAAGAIGGGVMGGAYGAGLGHVLGGGKGALLGGGAGIVGGALGGHFGNKLGNRLGTKIQKKMLEKGKVHPDFRKAYDEAKTKKSSVEKVAISFNQVNEASKIPGRISRAYESLKGPVGSAAKAVGSKAHGAVKALGNKVNRINDPIAKGTAVGALIGGSGGVVSGLLDPKEDPLTGEKQRLRSAFRRGVSGAAGGAVSGALMGSFGKTSSVQKLAAALEKQALGLNMGGIGSMAKNFVGQMKPVAQKAMGAVKPMAQNAMAKAAPMATKALGGKSMGQAAGMGAAVGAGLGAAKGLVAPGTNAQGQQNSRLGAMARGAAGGAALGAGAGAAAKAALPHMQKAYKSVTPGLHAPARTGANFVAQEHTAITPAFKPGVTQAIPRLR